MKTHTNEMRVFNFRWRFWRNFLEFLRRQRKRKNFRTRVVEFPGREAHHALFHGQHWPGLHVLRTSEEPVNGVQESPFNTVERNL